ncbi:MAG: glycosyltransferase family 2 protein [Lachnospiraceae bacterium]|nr:glycosyltransferase family 2 protein [Lachnospiraceae bacterium]
MDAMLTILTPTYNRGVQLKNLYESLKRQTNKNFIWYVVDDGSTDDTKYVIGECQQESHVIIWYDKKKNGGKHTALNYGIKRIETALTMIVDSDDLLTPDAVETICNDWLENCEQNICGMNYLRGYSGFEVIGKKWPNDEQIANSITLTCNKGIIGDKAEVFVTDILKEYPFPEIPGEKFFSESYVWLGIARKYDMFMRNKIIYITEYLDGGLSKSGRNMQLNSPVGAMMNAAIRMNKEFSMKLRFKNSMLYSCYGVLAKKKFGNLWRETPSKLYFLAGYIPGMILKKYWTKKYL